MPTAVTTDRSWLTVAEIAERYRCAPEKVLGWIARGELRAVNIASRPGGKPRWRIQESDLAEFETSRAAVPRTQE